MPQEARGWQGKSASEGQSPRWSPLPDHPASSYHEDRWQDTKGAGVETGNGKRSAESPSPRPAHLSAWSSWTWPSWRRAGARPRPARGARGRGATPRPAAAQPSENPLEEKARLLEEEAGVCGPGRLRSLSAVDAARRERRDEGRSLQVRDRSAKARARGMKRGANLAVRGDAGVRGGEDRGLRVELRLRVGRLLQTRHRSRRTLGVKAARAGNTFRRPVLRRLPAHRQPGSARLGRPANISFEVHAGRTEEGRRQESIIGGMGRCESLR